MEHHIVFTKIVTLDPLPFLRLSEDKISSLTENDSTR